MKMTLYDDNNNNNNDNDNQIRENLRYKNKRQFIKVQNEIIVYISFMFSRILDVPDRENIIWYYYYIHSGLTYTFIHIDEE